MEVNKKRSRDWPCERESTFGWGTRKWDGSPCYVVRTCTSTVTRFGSTINRKRDQKTGGRLQRVSEGEGERKMNKRMEVRRLNLRKVGARKI